MSANQALSELLANPLPLARKDGALGQARRFEKTGRSSGVSGLRRHLNALALADPEAIRTEVIARGRDPFINGLIGSLEETGRYCSECERGGRERWAFRLYAELAKLVGSAGDIALTVVNLVGAQPGVAKSAVETVQRVRDMSPRERAEGMADALSKMGWHCEPPEGWSSAEVVETNGNGHGP